jgi:hypothetical protein
VTDPKPILRDLSARLMHLAWDCAYGKLPSQPAELTEPERRRRRKARKAARTARRRAR